MVYDNITSIYQYTIIQFYIIRNSYRYSYVLDRVAFCNFVTNVWNPFSPASSKKMTNAFYQKSLVSKHDGR
jgi:hypothetical protein